MGSVLGLAGRGLEHPAPRIACAGARRLPGLGASPLGVGDGGRRFAIRSGCCHAEENWYDGGVMRRANMVVVLLLVNLGLVLAFALLYKSTRQPSPPSEPGAAIPAAYAAVPAPSLKVVKTNIVETNAFRWSQLETEDYRAYIERLRAIGCPEQTIRDLVIADVDKLFAARILEVNPAARELKYWEADQKDLESGEDHLERQRQQREIDFAKRHLIRDLLGVDLVSERNKVQGAEDRFGRRLGFLPEDKRGQVRMLLEHFNGLELGVRQKTWEEGETLTEEDQAQLLAIQQQRDQAVAAALSPAELEQYQRAMSPLAYEVRDSLFGMKASEEEYLAVYQARKEFQESWGDQPPEDPQRRVEWEEAQALLQASLREKLGDDRYNDYLRAKDPDFRQLSIAVARGKAPPEAATHVYEFKRIAIENRARVAGNRSLTPDQQQAALNAMAAETEQTVRAVLGEKAYQTYLRSGQGKWIQGLGEGPASAP